MLDLIEAGVLMIAQFFHASAPPKDQAKGAKPSDAVKKPGNPKIK